MTHPVARQFNYAKLDSDYRRHHERYKRHVKHAGLCCQECHGAGSTVEDVIFGHYLRMPCGWCEGTGKVTRWLRGRWLSEQRATRKAVAHA